MSKKTATAAHLSDALPERQEGVPVLQIKDLNVRFPSEDGVVHAVRGVNPVSYTHLTLPTIRLV